MELREMWNNLADSFQKTVNIQSDYTAQLFEHLRSRGALVPGNWVADIGCGAGKNAITFAEEGMRVLLIDVSDRMLEYSRSNLGEMAERCEFAECDFASSDIRALGWEKRVDLAFASMTPAVNERGGIERMCLMSRGGCLITTFIDRTDAFAKEVSELAGVDLPEPDRQEVRRYETMVDIIESLSYSPEVTVVNYDWENLLAPDEAAERFFNGRTLELEDCEENRSKIAKAVGKLTGEDGLVSEKVFTHVAWIWWKV